MTTIAAQRPTEFNRGALGALFASIVAMVLGPTGIIIISYSLFIEPMAHEFGWSRAEASLPVTLMALAIALASPVKGWAVDRWGPRALVLPLTALLGLAVGGLAVAPRQGWIAHLLFTLIGLAAPGNVPFGRIVASWFDRKLGMAYGLLGFGFTLAMPAGLQFGRLLVDGYGWRVGYAAFGVAQLALALPLLAALFRDPEDAAAKNEMNVARAVLGDALGEALRSARYWLLLVNLVAAVVVISALATHGVPMLTQRGLSRDAASWALSAFFTGTALSQPLLGLLLDRGRSPRVTLPFGLAALAGFLLLFTASAPVAWIFALALIGLGCGGESGTTQYFVARYFGLRRFSTIYGSVQPFTMIGGALLGASGVGYLFDRSGSYAGAAIGLAFILLLGTGVILAMPRYRYGRG